MDGVGRTAVSRTEVSSACVGCAAHSFRSILTEGNDVPQVAVPRGKGQETLTVRENYLQLNNSIV